MEKQVQGCEHTAKAVRARRSVFAAAMALSALSLTPVQTALAQSAAGEAGLPVKPASVPPDDEPASRAAPMDSPPNGLAVGTASTNAALLNYQERLLFLDPPERERPSWDHFKKNQLHPVELSEAALYSELGRPDLAQLQVERSTRKTLMIAYGAGLAGAGLIAALATELAGLRSGSSGFPYSVGLSLSETPVNTQAAVGLAVVAPLVGISIALVGAGTAAHPASLEEVKKMVAEHNARLRAQAGVADKPRQ